MSASVVVPVAVLSDLHERLGRLEGAVGMAVIVLAGYPSGDEVRQVAKRLEEIAFTDRRIGQEQER